ncbi:MAG: hypothetical protein KIT22_06970, partial [Verrucomicrobiae bacterium]|nr:hypothetical protein [Verrucomicrobiae bacterium]
IRVNAAQSPRPLCPEFSGLKNRLRDFFMVKRRAASAISRLAPRQSHGVADHVEELPAKVAALLLALVFTGEDVETALRSVDMNKSVWIGGEFPLLFVVGPQQIQFGSAKGFVLEIDASLSRLAGGDDIQKERRRSGSGSVSIPACIDQGPRPALLLLGAKRESSFREGRFSGRCFRQKKPIALLLSLNHFAGRAFVSRPSHHRKETVEAAWGFLHFLAKFAETKHERPVRCVFDPNRMGKRGRSRENEGAGKWDSLE